MRNPVFDIMKGLAILLMLIGHMAIPADGFLNKFIYSFHMPLFFLLAGYFAKSCEEANLSKTKMFINDSKRLLVPYIITSVAILIFTLVRVLMKHDVSIIMDKLYHIFYRFDIIPIWFLIALLWIRVLFRPMMRLGKWALPVSIFLSGAAIFIVHHYTQLPFCILTALSALSFYAIGWWHKKYGFPRWLVVCAMLCWIGVMMGRRIDLYNIAYGIYPLTLLGASGATYAIYKIVSFVHQRWEKSVILSVLRWMGVNSLILICFHAFDIYCCYVTMIMDGICGIDLGYWPTQIIRDGMVLLLSWIYVTYVRPCINELKNEGVKELMNKIPEKWQQPIRFAIVGGLATAIHYGVYLLLQLWMWPWLAYTLGYAISFVVNYMLTNYFTFKTRPTTKNGIGFVISHAINYGLHIGLLELFLWIGVSNEWAPIPVFCIVIPVNFFILRFVFIKLAKNENK